MEKYIYLFLIFFFAYLPSGLVLSKKIVRKKFFFTAVIAFSLLPLSTVFVPAFFDIRLFDGPMLNYIKLMAMYYFFSFLFYLLFIFFIPTSDSLNFQTLKRPSKLAYLVFFLALVLFSILVVNSGGVFLYDPRGGYQYHREGVGFIWVLYISLVSILFFLLCVKREINLKKVIFFIFLMFMTGSKKLILDVLLKSVLVYFWSNKKIKKRHFFIVSFLLVILMLKQFDQFGAKDGFIKRVSVYYDFMKLATLVFEDYEQGKLKFTNGEITLTSFWSYVPRMFYPEKPYVYGPVTLVEMYYPGLAETGHTPSFGKLTPEFVDFGFFAPILALILNLGQLTQMLALLIVSTNARLSKRWVVGSMLFVLCPGFGFHLPIMFSLLIAFIVVPMMFVSRRRLDEK